AAIIHRDLKPSNILVVEDGARAMPKIIDFGTAKALGATTEVNSGWTRSGQILGTPEYMSPEQAALDGRPVDTPTDGYSLGVILYELLTGGRPIEEEPGTDGGFPELCRRIREEEPERPSAHAVRREGDEARFSRSLRGDLDAVVLKALAKDPAERYG